MDIKLPLELKLGYSNQELNSIAIIVGGRSGKIMVTAWMIGREVVGRSCGKSSTMKPSGVGIRSAIPGLTLSRKAVQTPSKH